MPYDPIRVNVTEVEICENGRFQCFFPLPICNVIKRPMVTRQYLNFYQTDFWYSSFGVTWPSNLRCSTFDQGILPVTRSWLAVLYVAYLFTWTVWLICLSSGDSEHIASCYMVTAEICSSLYQCLISSSFSLQLHFSVWRDMTLYDCVTSVGAKWSWEYTP